MSAAAAEQQQQELQLQQASAAAAGSAQAAEQQGQQGVAKPQVRLHLADGAIRSWLAVVEQREEAQRKRAVSPLLAAEHALRCIELWTPSSARPLHHVQACDVQASRHMTPTA